MFPVPVTYYFDFDKCDPSIYPCILDEFARNGARHIVLTDGLMGTLTRNAPDIAGMEKHLKDSGLTFCDAHALYGLEWCLNCPYEKFRKVMVEHQKMAISLCHYFNVKTVTIHVGSMRHAANQVISKEDHILHIKEALSELLPHAEKEDVVICIENIWHNINTPEALLEIKKDFPTPYLGFCYDAGHANIMNNGRLSPTGNAWDAWKICGVETPPWDDQILEKMLPHIVNCHLHDNKGIKDDHDLPGKGNINWSQLLPTLVKAPNLKVIQSEVIHSRHGLTIGEVCRTFEKMGKDLSL